MDWNWISSLTEPTIVISAFESSYLMFETTQPIVNQRRLLSKAVFLKTVTGHRCDPPLQGHVRLQLEMHLYVYFSVYNHHTIQCLQVQIRSLLYFIPLSSISSYVRWFVYRMFRIWACVLTSGVTRDTANVFRLIHNVSVMPSPSHCCYIWLRPFPQLCGTLFVLSMAAVSHRCWCLSWRHTCRLYWFEPIGGLCLGYLNSPFLLFERVVVVIRHESYELSHQTS